MTFQFTLASLLRLRRSLEHQRALALQQASLNVARAREALARLESFLEESACADARSLSGGRMAAELHFASLLRERLQNLRVQIQNEVRHLETLRHQAVIAYRQSLGEREALEGLCARQHSAYQLEQTRRRQQEVDAIFLLQRWQGRDG